MISEWKILKTYKVLYRLKVTFVSSYDDFCMIVFVSCQKDPRVSLTLTLAQTPYCRVKGFDPEDPRCAQVILTGRFVIVSIV